MARRGRQHLLRRHSSGRALIGSARLDERLSAASVNEKQPATPPRKRRKLDLIYSPAARWSRAAPAETRTGRPGAPNEPSRAELSQVESFPRVGETAQRRAAELRVRRKIAITGTIRAANQSRR